MGLLEPLCTALDPVSLARLARASSSLHHALAAVDASSSLLWAASASSIGIACISSREALADYFRQTCVFSPDAAFGAIVSDGGRKLLLQLGSEKPITRRVAATSSIVSLAGRNSVHVDLRVISLPARESDTILWLGVMYFKHERRTLDRAGLPSALAGYDMSTDPSNSRLMERFATSDWSLSAIGSNGAVWADGSVTRLLGPAYRFGSGDVVHLTVDTARRQLCVAVNGGPSTVAVKRLLPRSGGFTPRVHACVQLTDIACPKLSRVASATVEVVGEFSVT